MKSIIAVIAVLCLASVAIAQDNPLPQVGQVGSGDWDNNLAVPYTLGGGQGMYVKARIDVGSTAYIRRPLADLGLSFDSDGSFYYNTVTSGSGNSWNSGVTKFNANGTVAWANIMPNGTGGGIAGSETIVGSDYLYSRVLGTNTLYALNKTTGATQWQTNLTSAVGALMPVLHDGYLYGVEANNSAYVVNAATGAVVYESAALAVSTGSFERPIFLPNLFGNDPNGNPQHGLIWKNGSTLAIKISADPGVGAAFAWSTAWDTGWGNWNYSDAYNPATNQIYRFGGDAAPYYTAEGLNPVTGSIQWRLQYGNVGYQGFAVVNDPNHPGFVLEAQGTPVRRIDTTVTCTDPNTGLTMLGAIDPNTGLVDPSAAYMWTAGTSQGDWNAANRINIITDPTTGRQIAVWGTEGNGSYNKRIMGVDVATGATVFEFLDPNDPAPTLYNYGGENWRNMSISPNGDIVWWDHDAFNNPTYGINGRIMIVSSLMGDNNADHVVDVNDLNNVYNTFGSTGAWPTYAAGDGNGDGVVDVQDLNDVYNNFAASVTPADAAVPEPATLVLLGLGGLALIRRGRK